MQNIRFELDKNVNSRWRQMLDISYEATTSTRDMGESITIIVVVYLDILDKQAIDWGRTTVMLHICCKHVNSNYCKTMKNVLG